MAIPYREFDGEPGDYSVDTAGPEQLQDDLDKLFTMFDPEATHADGSAGGISMENFSEPAIEANFYAAVSQWINDHPEFILGKLVATHNGNGRVTLTFQHDSIPDEGDDDA